MSKITDLFKDDELSFLSYNAKIPKERLQLPSPDWIDKVFKDSDRSIPTLCSLQRLFSHGRLANTGYLSILPVDQGVEHSAGASFDINPSYFDPNNIIKLALEAGCNGVATTLGTLSIVARRYAHKIPLILKLNHNELLSFPAVYDQTVFASVKQAYNMGCVAVGATIYFGSQESRRQIQEVSKLFALAHELGMATILWCYLRNSQFKTGDVDFHNAADLTGQANYLGATIGADIVKQKLPTNNGGFKRISFGKYTDKMYGDLLTDNPIDLCRYQVANCYMGNIGLINSGGASTNKKDDDLKKIVETAMINKIAGGMGVICGRKAFKKSLKDGITLLNYIQDVYLDKEITIS